MQDSHRAASSPASHLLGVGVDCPDGAEVCALVKGLYALQVCIHQLPACEVAGQHGGMALGNGQLLDGQLWGAALAQQAVAQVLGSDGSRSHAASCDGWLVGVTPQRGLQRRASRRLGLRPTCRRLLRRHHCRQRQQPGCHAQPSSHGLSSAAWLQVLLVPD